jgi:hypothetical protein
MTGYDSKRQMAADKLQEPINLLEARKIAAEYGTPDSQVDNGNLYFALSKCLEHIDAQPAQKPSATRPCRSCNGTGDRDTGIAESPIATCKPCTGTGQIALAQPPLPVQRTWVGLEKSDMPDGADPLFDDPKFIAGMVYAANKLKEKNT